MTNVRNLIHTVARDDDSDLEFINAVDKYPVNLWDREVTRERFPLDALVFAGWQTPLTSFEQFKADRCKYDRETNAWLQWYVSNMAAAAKNGTLPPVLIHIRPNGLCL